MIAKLKLWLSKLRALPGLLFEVLKAVFSRDPQTRRTALYFWLSFAGMLAVLALTSVRIIQRVKHHRDTQPKDTETLVLEEHQQKQAELARLRNSTLELGTFVMSLRREENDRNPRSVLQAEFEIVLQCREPETCEYIKMHRTQVSDVITAAFVPMTREEVLSTAGKKQIKRLISEKMNAWLPKGQVEQVYFSSFVAR